MVTYLYFHIQYEHTGPAFSISKTQWGVRLLKWNVFISFSLSPYSLQFHHRVHIRQLPTTTFTLFSYSKLMSGFHSFVWQHLFVYLPWRRSSTACRLMQNWRHGAEVGHLTSATANVLSEFVLHCPLPRMVYLSSGRTESSKIRKLGSPGAPADSKRTRLFFPWCVEEFFTRGWYARLHSNNLPWGFGGYIVSCSEHWGSPRQRLTFPQGLPSKQRNSQQLRGCFLDTSTRFICHFPICFASHRATPIESSTVSSLLSSVIGQTVQHGRVWLVDRDILCHFLTRVSYMYRSACIDQTCIGQHFCSHELSNSAFGESSCTFSLQPKSSTHDDNR